MRTFPVPFNEEARVAAVQNVPGLSRDNNAVFDMICHAAAKLLDCPIAHISVIEEETQWYKSVIGMELPEMPKNQSFCTHTIMSEGPMVIPDLSKDPKFVDHPMVAEGGPQARFYAGVPLILSSGYRFGSLCALDLVPHEAPSEKVMSILEDLGKAVVAALEKAPAKDAAELTDQGQNTFLTLVSHELRTPLTIVQGGLRILDFRLKEEAEKKLAASSIKSSDHLAKLNDSILKYSNLQTGELQLNPSSVSLDEFLESVLQEHEPTALASEKTLNISGIGVVGPVLADREHLNICVTSLLLNSILHGGKTITVKTNFCADGHIEILIEDDGNMDDHVDLAQLYKPFVVGGDVEKRGTQGGLGLGLPLTRKLVELHGGEFEVRTSETSTTACIRLPKWRLVC